MSRSLFPHVVEEVYAAAMDKTAYLFRQGFQLSHIHQYTNSEGKPTWWVLRLENDRIDPKTGKRAKCILPLRRTEKGYELKQPIFLKGFPLYNQHLLANYLNDLVYLVEGEKCADLLVQLGFIAITWPFGAASVLKVDFSPLLGRRVVCWPDHDVHGVQAMKSAEGVLQKTGAFVVTLAVAGMGLPHKGDVCDWLDRFLVAFGGVDLCAIPNGQELAIESIRVLQVVDAIGGSK